MENTAAVGKEIAGKAGHIALRVAIYALLIVGAFVLVFPYLWMLLTSFKDDYEAMSLTLVLFPKKWIFTNYSEIWTVVPLLRGVANTLIVEVSVIVVVCRYMVSVPRRMPVPAKVRRLRLEPSVTKLSVVWLLRVDMVYGCTA